MNESPSDDRAARVTARWHLDPCGAATVELHRRNLSDHYRSVGAIRRWQLSSAIVRARIHSLPTDRAPLGHTHEHEYDSPAMDHCCRCSCRCLARSCGMAHIPKEEAIR